MMRLIVTALFTALLVLGVWTFFDSTTFLLGPERAGYRWWWPTDVSTYGGGIDLLFVVIGVMILVFFVLTYVVLIGAVFGASRKSEEKAAFTHGNHKLELLWTAVPAVLLLIIAFSQMQTWAAIKFRGAIAGEEIRAEAIAEQFDWRFRYPGTDGVFGTVDDIHSATDFVVPVDDKFVFHLRSNDVLHSFFVPKLRLKQDAVPGMTIPMWLEVDPDRFAREAQAIELADGSEGRELVVDLICAELCGWGHYKMAGRVRMLSKNAFEAWMAEQEALRFDNGEPE